MVDGRFDHGSSGNRLDYGVIQALSQPLSQALSQPITCLRCDAPWAAGYGLAELSNAHRPVTTLGRWP
jgi:hypothetical protein